MRKTLLSLALATLIVAMFAAPALAATFDLPVPPPVVNNDTQMGWATAGFENENTPENVPLDTLKSMKALVLEVSAEPEGDDIHLIWQSPDHWWQDTTFKCADVYKDGKITINFSDLKDVVLWSDDGNGERAKFLVAYYGTGSGNVAELGITKAYLTDGAAAADTAASDNVKTGDSTFIFFALGTLAIAGTAAVFAARKVKS